MSDKETEATTQNSVSEPIASDSIEKALQALAAALEAGDAVAADIAASQANEILSIFAKNNKALDKGLIQSLKQLKSKCDSAAENLQKNLKTTMLQAGKSRKAVEAYNPRRTR